MSGKRHVIWIATGFGWGLEPAQDFGVFSGGARSMHELAVAIAATGRRVEVRGGFDQAELQRLGDAAGAWPEWPTDTRMPDGDDVVIAPEGHGDERILAPILLSAARLIMMVMAPPGLFGWPFVKEWSLRPPTAVEVDQVARPEHFRALASVGIELWTHMPHVVALAQAAGVECKFIGNGRPMPYPDPPPKRFDVATLANSRWAKQAREVAQKLEAPIAWHEISACSNEEMLTQIGRARILIHPLRIEGHSRIGQEARAMGTVPVVLNTSPFSVGLDEAGGAVALATTEEMPEAIARLLQDPERLRALSERGISTARQQIDWDTYVERVDAALSAPSPVAATRIAAGGMDAWSVITAALHRDYRQSEAALAQITEHRDSMEQALPRVTEHRDALLSAYADKEAELGRVMGHRDALVAERDALVAERDALVAERDALARAFDAEHHLRMAMQSTRAWRAVTSWWRIRDRLRAAALKTAARK